MSDSKSEKSIVPVDENGATTHTESTFRKLSPTVLDTVRPRNDMYGMGKRRPIVRMSDMATVELPEQDIVAPAPEITFDITTLQTLKDKENRKDYQILRR